MSNEELDADRYNRIIDEDCKKYCKSKGVTLYSFDDIYNSLEEAFGLAGYAEGHFEEFIENVELILNKYEGGEE